MFRIVALVFYLLFMFSFTSDDDFFVLETKKKSTIQNREYKNRKGF